VRPSASKPGRFLVVVLFALLACAARRPKGARLNDCGKDDCQTGGGERADERDAEVEARNERGRNDCSAGSEQPSVECWAVSGER